MKNRNDSGIPCLVEREANGVANGVAVVRGNSDKPVWHRRYAQGVAVAELEVRSVATLSIQAVKIRFTLALQKETGSSMAKTYLVIIFFG